MARASFQRDVVLDTFQHTDGTVPVPIPLMAPPLGAQTDLDARQISPSGKQLVENLVIRHDAYVTRAGTTTLGTAYTGDVVATYTFVLSDGTSYVFRFLTTKPQRWNGSAWADVSGISGLTGTVTDNISIVGWNDTLIFSNGVDGTYTINPSANTGAVIAAAPAALSLTILAKRLIACGISTNNQRTQWSVAGDYTDWSGLGSGYEDLLATPGGFTDTPTVTIPVSDDSALMIREQTIWSVHVSGFVDAPFQFSRAYASTGSDMVQSAAAIPGGVIFTNRKDIFRVTLDGGVVPIGGTVREEILAGLSTSEVRRVCGLYDITWDTYYLFVPGSTTDNVVWACHKARTSNEPQWTKLTYPYAIQHVTFGRQETALQTDQLAGDTDVLTGQTDDLGVSLGQLGLMITPAVSNSYIIVEDMTETNNASGRDVDSAGSRTTGGFNLVTGNIYPKSSYNRVTLLRVVTELKATKALTLSMAISDDNGETFETAQNLSVSVTSASEVVRFISGAERESITIKLFSTNCGYLNIVRAVADVMHGAEVAP